MGRATKRKFRGSCGRLGEISEAGGHGFHTQLRVQRESDDQKPLYGILPGRLGRPDLEEMGVSKA